MILSDKGNLGVGRKLLQENDFQKYNMLILFR